MKDTKKLQHWIKHKKASPWFIYIKRLSGNDTGLTKGHQSGIYIPKDILFTAFPSINNKELPNPDFFFEGEINSHDLPKQKLRAVYYNNKFNETNKGTRDEQRITCWKQNVLDTPVQNPECTGALTAFAFHKLQEDDNANYLAVWVCQNELEEQYLEDLVGEVLPGQSLHGNALSLLDGMILPSGKSSNLELPQNWLTTFPETSEIVNFVIKQESYRDLSTDDRLMKRRELEFSVFKQIEQAHVFPTVNRGFETVEAFITFANSVGNRRKSRSGYSLELHLEALFREEGLVQFGVQCITEGKKKPDFLFPSCEAYHDPDVPNGELSMLAVKTTCKDRWRQILQEADRISEPYLFTLQQGVSENQFEEMKKHGVQLVVPDALHKSYPKNIQPELISLNDFIKRQKENYSVKPVI